MTKRLTQIVQLAAILTAETDGGAKQALCLQI